MGHTYGQSIHRQSEVVWLLQWKGFGFGFGFVIIMGLPQAVSVFAILYNCIQIQSEFETIQIQHFVRLQTEQSLYFGEF